MRHILALALVAAVCLLTAIPAAQGADEFRGLYVDAFHPGLANHAEVTQMVKAAKDANFNAIFVQVRKRGDAYYQSALEPKAKGVAADYDPLADILRQAHAAGLQVHAWLAVYEVAQTTGWNVEDRGNHISKVHPDWLMSDKDGKTTIGKSRVFVDPGLPAVQDNFVAIVRDILTKYSVDGIHLEDPGYRDPNAGYNSGSVAKFNEIAQRTGIPATTDEDWRQWRTAQVTNLIRGVHNAIKAIRPSAALSVCVASYSPNDTRKDSLQEWDVWAREGLVDFLVPMLSSSQEYMSGIASSAVASAAGRHIYIGIGTYKLTAAAAAEQICATRASTAKGIVLFSYHYLQLEADKTTLVKMSDLASVFIGPATIPADSEVREEGTAK